MTGIKRVFVLDCNMPRHFHHNLKQREDSKQKYKILIERSEYKRNTENVCVEGKVILKRALIVSENADCIRPDRALVNKVTNFRVFLERPSFSRTILRGDN
jgi:hypothetical protein